MPEDGVVVAQVSNNNSAGKFGTVIALALMLWVFLLHASPSLFHTFPLGLTLGNWRMVALIGLAAVLAFEAYSFFDLGGSSSSIDENAEIKPVKRTIEYPPKITGVIYADTYVALTTLSDIKMRTMLARTCALCENKDDCWEKTKGRISEDDFASNMECIEGLQELGVNI